ncbi:MAG: hypothetical protein ACK4GL_09000 [Flavobacteriales bacterium]
MFVTGSENIWFRSSKIHHAIYTCEFNNTKNAFERIKSITGEIALTAATEVITPEPVHLSDDTDFYSLYNGFALARLNKRKKEAFIDQTFLFRSIKAFNNDTIFVFHPDTIIPRGLNNICIEWIVPNLDGVRYQFKLDNAEQWSDLSSSNTFEILNLKPGKHRLRAKAWLDDTFTDPQYIIIRIAAPWCRTNYAYVGYTILILLLVFAQYQRQKHLLNKQKNVLMQHKQAALKTQAAQHEQEVKAMEQALLQKEYDQLKQQLKSKTIKLANKAKDNDEKKSLVLTL